MTIQYVPWEDEDAAKTQLADYVKAHPDAELRLEENQDKANTFLLIDNQETIAIIHVEYVLEGNSENSDLVEGLSYRQLLKNTQEYKDKNKDKDNKQPEILETVDECLYCKAIGWLNKHKKFALTCLGTFSGIMLLYVSCKMVNMYSEPDYNVSKAGAASDSLADKIQKDINEAKALLSDNSSIKLDKRGYASMAKVYSGKVKEYKKEGLYAGKVAELETLVKKFEVKAK